MKAGDIIDRIKKALDQPWRDATFRDTFKFGGPDTEVTGIATTVFVTMEVIQKAAAAGLNMIVPHEDTFWNDRDDTTLVSADPLYKTKVDLMTKHNIVIFRIHDHMHSQRPDFTYVGSARAIGLDPRHETAPNSHRFVIPETTLGELAASVKKYSGARALRVVGNPSAKVSRIQLGVGYATPAVNNAEVDVVISGEQQESDGGFDSPRGTCSTPSRSAWRKAGSRWATPFSAKKPACSRWRSGLELRPDVPVQLVSAGEPFSSVR